LKLDVQSPEFQSKHGLSFAVLSAVPLNSSSKLTVQCLPAAAASGGAIGHTPPLTGNAHPPLATGFPVALGPATGRPDADGDSEPGTDGDEPDPGKNPGRATPMEMRVGNFSVTTPTLAATKSTTPIGSSVHAHHGRRRECRAGGATGIVGRVGSGW
jgi:hypothetical protein